ncbi:hypothetical protein NZK35_25210 [Stieleria sp. ICT_E10.1]|uniref:hypothetical protein n=1 Tax=Stieleria sedimenti TaxID=2976331 RepID=UPI002180225F|nr:hypothetical protein [Stieleria sedimenti]MCS7469964.1 hypothetical protein [Stieleria sedimenti]
MQPSYSNSIVAIAFCLSLAFVCGCEPVTSSSGERAPVEKAPATEDDMHELISKESVFHVLKNVDRPFETQLEPGSIWIDPNDPILAHCVMYCTHAMNGTQTRSLFFTTFHNDAYPNFASTAADVRCVVVNRDGTVVFRDDDYFRDDTHEQLVKAGAADTDGPPEVAVGLLKMAELRAKYVDPEGEP